ncbi:coproporphyrinogen III oxidase, anaerobic [Ruaniaceae bacterium KH17]|nr:coproporphyrinogen III oxidase, anaerobic [Ruaniaceae bacterium KH17]
MPDGPLSGVELGPAAPFSLYVHVPYCSVRCGYCDFNTYTASELGGGASRASYAHTAIVEIRMAAQHLREVGRTPERVETVFFGGGTPTILPASDLAAMLDAARDEWGLADGAEVTTEANPDTVDEAYAAELAVAGFTRMSIGMQSAVPHVLATLDRTHTPANVARAVAAAKAAGLQVSLDLIYGSPGESLADWRTSLESVLALEPNHVSAYALGIEPGTKMGAQLRRGEITATDPNALAEMYELADEVLAGAGYDWYEISNWARGREFQCRHNLAYWRNSDWWGIGPGAHSHAGTVRWWNVKHPRAYEQQVAAGELPVADHEVLTPEEQEFERIMLGVRLAEGLTIRHSARSEAESQNPETHVGLDSLPGSCDSIRYAHSAQDDEGAVAQMDDGECAAQEGASAWRAALAQLVRDGLAESAPAWDGVVVLTREGRLQADAVTRLLTDL